MKNFLEALRIKEIIGKAGFFFTGVLFAAPATTLDNLILIISFGFVCLLNGVAIYLINAGFGYNEDKKNERLKIIQDWSRWTVLITGGVLSVLGIIAADQLSDALLIPSLFVYMIWIAYSIRGGLKGIPLMGLATAFAAQLVHFHIGYVLFSSWGAYMFIISGYFALLFTAGHALHEVIDYEADAQAGVRTSAVCFGRKTMFLVSTLLFTVAAICFTGIGIVGLIDWKQALPFALAYLFQLVLIIRLPKNWTNDDLFAYRRKYMLAYAIATTVLAIMIYRFELRLLFGLEA